MSADHIWRGCLWSYLIGLAIVMTGLIGLFLTDFLTDPVTLPTTMTEIAQTISALAFLTVFVALAGLVLSVPMVTIAFLIWCATRNRRTHCPIWLPVGIVSGITAVTFVRLLHGDENAMIIAALATLVFGLPVGLGFWHGSKPTPAQPG